MKAGDRDAAIQRIHALVDSIPCGCVATYGQIARESGLPRHARLVGRALAELPEGSGLPWHRVVNAQGRISPRPGGAPSLQARLLRAEGVELDEGGRIDLRRFLWKPDWKPDPRPGPPARSRRTRGSSAPSP